MPRFTRVLGLALTLSAACGPPTEPEPDPIITTFSPSATTVMVETTVFVTLRAQNVVSCTSGETFPADASSRVNVAFGVTTAALGPNKIRVSCVGTNGKTITREIEVKGVLAVKAILTASADTIFLGESVTLTGNCEGADSATRSWAPGASPVEIGEQVTPTSTGRQTFSYNCTGEGGSDMATVYVTVLKHLTLSVELSAKLPTDWTKHMIYVQKARLDSLANFAPLDSAAVSADGHATFTTRFTDGDCVEVVVRDRENKFFPTIVSACKGITGQEDYVSPLKLDRFPKGQYIPQGTHAGQTVLISPFLCFANDSAGGWSFCRRIPQRYGVGGRWEYFPYAWGSPLKIAYDRVCSTQPFGPADSVAMVQSVDSLNRDVGRVLGVVGDFSDLSFKPGPPNDPCGSLVDWKGLAVRLDGRLTGGVYSVDSLGNARAGLVSLPDSSWLNVFAGNSKSNAFRHELLHALLDVGHLHCRIKGLMSICQNSDSQEFGKVTLEEMAYLQFVLDYAPARVKLTNPCSVQYLLDGQRVFELSLPRETIACYKP